MDETYLDSVYKVCYTCREQIKYDSWYAFGVIYECPYSEGTWQHKVWTKGWKRMLRWEQEKKAKETRND